MKGRPSLVGGHQRRHQCFHESTGVFFLSGASRRTPPRLATPGKKGLGTPTSDRHSRARKGFGCGPTSITHATESAVFAVPLGKACGPHLRAGGLPSHRGGPIDPNTSPHVAPGARVLRHVMGDKCPTRRISDPRRWGTPDLSPQRISQSYHDRECLHRRLVKR